MHENEFIYPVSTLFITYHTKYTIEHMSTYVHTYIILMSRNVFFLNK